jgi:hypothetical protein
VTGDRTGALVFDQGAADWIRGTVLAPVYPKGKSRGDDDSGSVAYGLIRLCPCQWGRCGHCSQRGVHTACVKHTMRPQPRHEATLLARRRDGWFGVAPVWRVGTPCRWVCECPCRPDGTMPGTPPKPRQGDLLDELLGLTS